MCASSHCMLAMHVYSCSYYCPLLLSLLLSLEKEMVQGCVPGYRTRGRQRRRWTDDITEWTGMKINEAAQQRKIVIVGEGYYAPPTLLMEDGTRRRRQRSQRVQLWWQQFLLIFLSTNVHIHISDRIPHRVAPYEELFSRGTRHHCPM